jgi:hypothetical protein
MKVQAEISYKLDEEPAVFKDVTETHNRVVYIWGKKRGYLTTDLWVKLDRISTMDQEPQNGFMEVWSTDNDISDPPKDLDDNWVETYKTISNNKYTIEWHTHINMLRFIWRQNLESLEQQKIDTQIVKAIGDFGLGFPNQPFLNPRY